MPKDAVQEKGDLIVTVAENLEEHLLYLCPELIIDKDVFLLSDRIERFRV